MSYIAKFNPYSMDNETILAVATGRKQILSQVLKVLSDNLKSSSSQQHLIIKGSRGMGKSFFLKYLMLNFNQKEDFKNCDFLLLPEEQNNINSPADLIKLIISQLKGDTGEDVTSFWEEPDGIWQIELNNLKDYISQQKELYKNYMLVVVIENFNDFLNNIQNNTKTRRLSESRFRHLLEKLDGLTIIGATPAINSEIDSNYNNRLFHAFKNLKLQKWTEEDYFKYFKRRKDIKIKEGESYPKEQTALMKAKLKALSKFTGGSPRMAVVLTNLLLKDDVISTVKTLFGLIDDLTPYYQDLTSRIPPKSRILFDTLIRKGENLSQSEVAEIVGTSQSKISKSFGWLKDNGYIIGKKRINSSAFSYQIADRIHVLYYQFREIHHNQSITPIWLLSDFLVAFYQEKELLDYANQYLTEQVDDISSQARDLELIGLNYYKLEKYNNAIDFHTKALIIRRQEKNISLQELNLGLIAWNYKVLNKYYKAIEFHTKALKISKQENNISKQAWNLGHIGENYILLDKWEKAMQLLNPKFELNEIVFKEFGDAIVFTEKDKGISEAFKVGLHLLSILEERKTWLNVNRSLSNLFASLLNMKISNTLFIDLCEEAKIIFTDKGTQVIIDAAMHTMRYVESGLNDAYLENLNPDTALALMAIVEESRL